MSEYKPLFVYLEPASIPQVVAHIQKYLSENPIVSDPEAIAEVIKKYIEEHPEIIAVASVNGKTGNVVLTGSDIMINPSSAVSVETQLLNLASMINNTGADVTQIQANISQIYTTIGTLQTDVETNASNISALQTSVEGQGTRLAAAETDIDNLESAQSAQDTRLNTAEGNISSLQTRLAAAKTNIDNLEATQTAQGTRLNAAEGNISSLQTRLAAAETNIDTNAAGIENLQTNVTSLTSPEQLSYQIMNGFADYDSDYNYVSKIGKLCVFHIVVIPTSTRAPGGLEFVIKGLPQPAHGVMFFGFVTDGVNVVVPSRMAIVGDGEGNYGIRFHYPVVSTLTNGQPVIMAGSYVTV